MILTQPVYRLAHHKKNVWLAHEIVFMRSKYPTILAINIQTKAFFSPDLSRDTEYHREQILCYSVRKSKVLQMQPSDEALDIDTKLHLYVYVYRHHVIWQSYMSQVGKAFGHSEGIRYLNSKIKTLVGAYLV